MERIEYEVEVRYEDGTERRFLFMTEEGASSFVADFFMGGNDLLEGSESVKGPNVVENS